MSEFPTRRVDSSQSESIEFLGSKPKFWFREGDRRFLFKADDRGTGEDWAEVIASHLCGLLGLPHVEYELAAQFDGERYVLPGVVCENMARKPDSLVLGNQMLLSVDPSYPTVQRFKVRQHTIEAVVSIMRKIEAPPFRWIIRQLPRDVQSALDVFAGYVMLDAWIANQDRHHENWGALQHANTLWLAPTFDHGAALARNITDDERQERLTTNDKNRTVAKFSGKGRSAFYGLSGNDKPLELREAFRAFAAHAPVAARAWQDRLQAVNRNAILSILERVPVARMSETCKRFTLELLLTNQGRLLE